MGFISSCFVDVNQCRTNSLSRQRELLHDSVERCSCHSDQIVATEGMVGTEVWKTDVKDRGGRPERGAVVMDGLLVAAAVLQEVGVVVVNFGIVRQSLDTRAKTSKDKDSFSCSEEKRHRCHNG